jgi:hypothetical protein
MMDDAIDVDCVEDRTVSCCIHFGHNCEGLAVNTRSKQCAFIAEACLDNVQDSSELPTGWELYSFSEYKSKCYDEDEDGNSFTWSDDLVGCVNLDKEILNCVDCLEAHLYWAHYGECFSDPNDGDIVVGAQQGYSPQELCHTYQVKQDENSACLLVDNCKDCLETSLKSDTGGERCQWFGHKKSDDGACYSTYCPSLWGPTCEEPIIDCHDAAAENDMREGFFSCAECLESGCCWTQGECSTGGVDGGGVLSICPAHGYDFIGGDTSREICLSYQIIEKDDEACGKMTNCQECLVTTLKSEESKSCRWFGLGTFDSFCAARCYFGPNCEEMTTCNENGGVDTRCSLSILFGFLLTPYILFF